MLPLVAQAETAAQSVVPTEAIEIDRVGLGRVDADVKGEAVVLVDAVRRRVPFDLLVDIVAEHRGRVNGRIRV